jgi:hypothetical protein
VLVIVGQDHQFADGAAGLTRLPRRGGLGDESCDGSLAIRDLKFFAGLGFEMSSRNRAPTSSTVIRVIRHPLRPYHNFPGSLLSPAPRLG